MNNSIEIKRLYKNYDHNKYIRVLKILILSTKNIEEYLILY